jgi:hypothetical protein
MCDDLKPRKHFYFANGFNLLLSLDAALSSLKFISWSLSQLGKFTSKQRRIFHSTVYNLCKTLVSFCIRFWVKLSYSKLNNWVRNVSSIIRSLCMYWCNSHTHTDKLNQKRSFVANILKFNVTNFQRDTRGSFENIW